VSVRIGAEYIKVAMKEVCTRYVCSRRANVTHKSDHATLRIHYNMERFTHVYAHRLYEPTSLRPALGMSSSTALARYASSLAYFLINSLLSSSAADGRFEGSF